MSSLNLTQTIPRPILQYLGRCLPSASELPRRQRVSHEGAMRLSPEGRWFPFQATTVVRLDRTAFRWDARLRLGPLIWLSVLDLLDLDEARLEARLWGRIPVQRANGEHVTEGQADRYLAELPWAPYAMLGNPELRWNEMDDRTIEVSVRGGPTVRFGLDPHGDIVTVTADRPRQVLGKPVRTPWRGTFSGYGQTGGLRLPARAVASWQLPEGTFTYWQATLGTISAGL